MPNIRLLSLLSIMNAALLTMAAHAVPTPTATTTPAAITAAADTTNNAAPATTGSGDAAPKPEAKPPSVNPLSFELGLDYASLDVTGNDKRFRQYVTPSEGFYVGQLSLGYQASTGKSLADIRLFDLGQPSAGGLAWLALGGNTLFFDGQQRNSEFYRDWTPDAESLRRRDDEYKLGLRLGPGELVATDAAVHLSGAMNTDPVNWAVRTPSVSYTGYFGNWRTSLGYAKEDFTFYTGPQISGKTNTVNFQLSPPETKHTSIEASGWVANTTLDGVSASPNAYNVALEGTQILTDDLSLSAQFNHNAITDSFVQNAYANKETNGDVDVQFAGIPHTLIDFGGGNHHVGYVNTLQTADIATDVGSVYAKATTRLFKWLKFKASTAHWWTSGKPASMGINGDQDGSLVWSSKDDQRLEASFSPTWNSGITGQWRALQWKNNDFGTNNTIIQQTVFGWWMPFDKLTLYASYLRQNLGLSGLASIPEQLPYVSDGQTYQYGMSYQLRPALRLDVDYTHNNTWGAEGVNQPIWTMGLSYTLRSGDELSLRGTLDNYKTSVNMPTENYQGNWFEIRYVKRLF